MPRPLLAAPLLLAVAVLLLRSGNSGPVRPSPAPADLRPSVPPASALALRPSAPPSATQPTAADEDALLRLIADARRETNPAARHERLAAICLHWAAFDPAAAVALAADLKLDPLHGALLPNLSQQWAENDFPSASAWADRLPAGDLRDQVFARLAFIRAQTSPSSAADLVAKKIRPGPEQDEAALSVLHPWARRDLAAALAWVRRLPAGDLRDRALTELEQAAATPSFSAGRTVAALKPVPSP
jgi:hypothetical protein